MSTGGDYPESGDEFPDYNGGITGGCGVPYDPAADGQRVCDCLADNIERIADYFNALNNILADRLKPPCNSIEQCTSMVYDELKRRLEGPLYSASECQRLAMSGQAGTIEYAIRCADNVIDDCNRHCDSISGDPNGKCCNTCGQANCVCADGQCIPAQPEQEEEEEQGYYIGYCNRASGLVIVLERGIAPPTGFEPVASSDSNSEALKLASDSCQKPITPKPQPELPPTSGSGSLPCRLSEYRQGNILDALDIRIREANVAAGGTSIYQALGDIGIAGLTVDDIGKVFEGLFTGATSAPLGVAEYASPYIANMVGCNSEPWNRAFQAIATAQSIGRYAGMDIDQWLLPFYYAMNHECPQRQLNADQAVAAFLANGMSQADLVTNWRLNGNCEPALAPYIQALKRKPESLQLAMMRHRQIISDSEFYAKMREIGFLDPQTSDDIFEITRQVPTLSDIIRFMVRDAGDEALVNKFNLDAEFDNKFGSQLKRWATDQGIVEDYARYAWRSHWGIPSPGQLFEFYHRLRNDPKFGPPSKLLDDIKDALIQQDILPYWHDHYLAISFRPMRLRDIRRSFEIGTLDDKGLHDAFEQLGYSDDTVGRMVDYTTRLRDRSIVNSRPVKQWLRFGIDKQSAVGQLLADGYPQAAISRAIVEAEPEFIKSEPAKAFARNQLNRLQFLALLTGHGVSDQAARSIADLIALKMTRHDALEDLAVGRVGVGQATQQMIDDGFNPAIAANLAAKVEHAVDNNLLTACIRAIKRRYVMGEIDQQQAINDLTGRGVVQARATKLVGWWDCELKLGRREVSASKLCQWLAQGAINAVQFVNRLVAIGYARVDAELMMSDCLTAANEKRLREAAKAAKEQAKAAEQIVRRAEQAAGKRIREEQRIKRLRDQSSRNKLSREKAFYTVIDKLTNKVENSIPDVAHFVDNEKTRIAREYGLSVDQTLQVLTLAANEYDGASLLGFPVVANQIAQATVDAELSGDPKQAVIPETNGSAK